MLVRIYSDIHNEVRRYHQLGRYQIPELPDDSTSVLILAGDVDSNIKILSSYLNQLAERFKEVLFTPGNHEYYSNDILTWRQELVDCGLDDNITLLELGQTKIIEDITFIGATLWGEINPSDEHAIKWAMNDFQVIKYNGKVLTPAVYTQLHKNDEWLLNEALNAAVEGRTTFVITHNSPSYQLQESRFAGGSLSCCFNTNLEHLIGKADYWVYGHSHGNIEKEIEGCQVMTNQVGYPFENLETREVGHDYIII